MRLSRIGVVSLLLSFLLMIPVVIFPGVARALTDLGSITVTTNASVTDSDMASILTDVDVDGLISGGYLSSSGLDARVLDGVTEIPFLLAEDKIVIAHSVSPSSVEDYDVTSGNTPLSSFPITIGQDGYITTDDDVDLEPGSDDFTIDMDGYFGHTVPYDDIIDDGFESGVGDWTVEDTNASSGEDYWGQNSDRDYEGSYSAWCAENGDTVGQVYDNDMEAYMYQTIDISSYYYAVFSYYYWVDSEEGYDFLYAGYYDGGWTWLRIYGGQLQAWTYDDILIPATATKVGFLFYSDSSAVETEGAYIDNVLLQAATESASSQILGKEDAIELYTTETPEQLGLDINGDTLLTADNISAGEHDITISREDTFDAEQVFTANYELYSGGSDIQSLYGYADNDWGMGLFPSSGTLSSLRAVLTPGEIGYDTELDAGDEIILTLYKNGSPTSLTCTIGEGEDSAYDDTHSVSVSIGDYFYIDIDGTGTAGSSIDHWNLCLSTTFNNILSNGVLIGSTPGNLSTTVTNYLSFAPYSGKSTEEGLVATLIPQSGNWLEDLYVELSGAGYPGTGKSYTFTVLVNGVATDISCTIQDMETTGSDFFASTGHSAFYFAGDTISLECVPSGTPIGRGCDFTLNNFGVGPDYFYPTGGSGDLDTTMMEYLPISGGDVEDSPCYVSQMAGGQETGDATQTIGNFYVKLENAPSMGNSRTFTVYKNDLPTDISITIADGSTSGSDTTHTFSAFPDDILYIVSSVSGTATAGWIQYGLGVTDRTGDGIDLYVDGDMVAGANFTDAIDDNSNDWIQYWDGTTQYLDSFDYEIDSANTIHYQPVSVIQSSILPNEDDSGTFDGLITWGTNVSGLTTSADAGTASITTSGATNITSTTARLNGDVVEPTLDSPSVTVYWGDNDGGTTPGNWDHSSVPTSPSQPQGKGYFYKDVSSLVSGTQYYFTASATNDAGTVWATTRTFTASTGTNCYWVGNSGSWSDDSNHWADSSGGTPGTGRVPLTQDTAIFDENSFSLANRVVTIDVTDTGGIDASDVTNTPTFTKAGEVDMYGSVDLGTVIWNVTDTYLCGLETGLVSESVLDTDLHVAKNSLYLSALLLGGNIEVDGDVYVERGTFNVNGWDLTADTFDSTDTTYDRAIRMGSGTVTLEGTSAGNKWAVNSSNLDFFCEDSTIILTNSGTNGQTFATGSETYNNITQAGAGIWTMTVTGSPVVYQLRIDRSEASKTISGDVTVTMQAFSLSVSSTRTVTITDTDFSMSTGIVLGDYLIISGSDAGGGAAFFANVGGHSTNNGGNTGWIWTAPTAPTVETQAATDVNNDGLTLNGEVLTVGNYPTLLCYFEYGATVSYGYETDGDTLTAVGTFDERLSPYHPYHYRAVIEFGLNDHAYGDDMTASIGSDTGQAESAVSDPSNSDGTSLVNEAPEEPDNMYDEGNSDSFPGNGLFDQALSDSDTPSMFFYGMIIFAIAIIGGFIVYYLTKDLLMQCVASGAIMAMFCGGGALGTGILPWWTVMVFGIEAICIYILQQRQWI